MKFNEAIEVLANFENNKLVKEGQLEYGLYRAYDVVGVLQKLQQEYAPTIEMTKGQYDFITSEYERENVVDAVANLTVDDFLRENFDAKFWEPLTQREVVQAWLRPETVKLVDYEI